MTAAGIDILDGDRFHPVARTSPSFARRVFARIEVTAGCWYWVGTLNEHGYGVVGRGARGAGNIPAHRAVWELLVGPVPDGLVFDHLCRNHACVSPEHGEIVTLGENTRRGYGLSRFHAARDRCSLGHLKDGLLGGRGGRERCRYCKTCARANSSRRYKLRTGALLEDPGPAGAAIEPPAGSGTTPGGRGE